MIFIFIIMMKQGYFKNIIIFLDKNRISRVLKVLELLPTTIGDRRITQPRIIFIPLFT